MPRLKFKLPCNDCPFRRKSLQGWLGSATPEEFAFGVGEAALPCHQTIDYDDEAWRQTQLPDAALCAGALILTSNMHKVPWDYELAAAVAEVERDKENVFSWNWEFIQHHNSGDFKSWLTNQNDDGPPEGSP